MNTAVIMAGGQSERMRATLGPHHKALVPVLGVPMLERNLYKLLSAGIDEIVVATSVHEPAIEDFVHTRGRALAKARGATVECFIERQPLGTIGVAGALRDRSDALLVVNVDNLTALDLKGLVHHHRRVGAALTIATHCEPFQIPFGEVKVCDGQITRYAEKPLRRIQVSSGTYVLGSRACELLPSDRRTDIPQLFATLMEHGESIAAFAHEAAWIDVNDAAALDKAERLMLDHAQVFEYWEYTPECQVVNLMLSSPLGILIEFRSGMASRYPGLWDMPGERCQPTDLTPIEGLIDTLREYSGWPCLRPKFLATFDDLDVATGQLIRHHVFVTITDRTPPVPGSGKRLQWIPHAAVTSSLPLSPALVRAMAALRRRT
jgi:NDP-mannose synthase